MSPRPSSAFAAIIVAGLVASSSVALGGCARPTTRAGDEVAPLIAVEQRGLAARIALMDRYRLHDEDRKRMMARPKVWVEEIPEEELAGEDANGDAPPTSPSDDRDARAHEGAPGHAGGTGDTGAGEK